MMFKYLAIGGGVFLVSVWMTNRLSSPSSRVRFLDHPNDRSLHNLPTPRTGGLAILASLASGILLAGAMALMVDGRGLINSEISLWFVGMVLLLALVSLWEDWMELPPGTRLAAHVLASAGVVLGAGLRIDSINIPLWGAWPLAWLAIPLTILFLVWMTNLYNFMDGMDGFAGGMAVLGFGFLAYLAWQGGQALTGILSFFTVGAAAGFLVYNIPPARIFMGDVGSTLLGFLAGAVSVFGVAYGLFDFWVPVLVFSPFIIDATATVLRRLFAGKKIWQAHREHYYQRLVLLGWSHRKTVLAEYCLMIACGVSAVIYMRLNESARLMLLIAWALIYFGLAQGVRLVERRSARGKQSLETLQERAAS
jgi:UDP-N-acetylmuramyl pentapeptide phosphotransferase/UDP-N-acetylglucosamine-1-phosphate transferase